MAPQRDTWQYAVDVATIALPLVAILVTVAAYGLTYWRRPSVSIEEDVLKSQSHLEGSNNELPHMRLLGTNKGWRRAAHGTQVIVIGYRRGDQQPSEMRSLGSPVLGWPSANAPNEAVTIFPGMARPIDFGQLYPTTRGPDDGFDRVVRWTGTATRPEWISVREGGQWQFRLGLRIGIADFREYLPPGEWIVTLAIGANDGTASKHDIHLAWNGDEPDPRLALDYLLDHLAVVKAAS